MKAIIKNLHKFEEDSRGTLKTKSTEKVQDYEPELERGLSNAATRNEKYKSLISKQVFIK